jgi:outer membrane protein TolC
MIAALALAQAAAAQVSAPAMPVAPPPTPAITTAPVTSKQPPVAEAMNLPEAPAPQGPSNAVLDQLKVATPRSLGHGVSTPTATVTPLLLSLEDAVRLALEHNLTISIDLQNQQQIKGLQLTAFNALIPSLSASAQTSTQQINLAAMGFKPQTVAGLLPPGMTLNTIIKVSTTSARLNLDQQLFNLPALEVYRASKATAEVAKWNILLDRGDVVQRVAAQYLRALADTASITNAQSQVASDTELERQAQARKDAGVGTNLDLIRARVARPSKKTRLS